MKDKTFKQQVEDAVKQSIFEVTGCADLKAGKLYLSKVLTKSVLAAHNAELDRIAEGLPSTLTSLITGYNAAQYKEQVEAYIQTQKGS